jgi:hypothetical protein
MGIGDQIMGAGLARGAAARGKRIAFGDGRTIRWDSRSEPIFRGNPNVAPPGSEGAGDLDWIEFHKGHRLYNTQDRVNNRWLWNLDFHAIPGEMFFAPSEELRARRYGSGFVLIEPNVVAGKSCGPNKDWGRENYQQVAFRLIAEGYEVCQFKYPGSGDRLAGVRSLPTFDIRDALAILANAALYIGPEGGTHHGAAAVGVPAVVLFGGFIPPSVTGYETHANLTGGAEACGSLSRCAHCEAAMRAISVDDVCTAALERL